MLQQNIKIENSCYKQIFGCCFLLLYDKHKINDKLLDSIKRMQRRPKTG